MIINIDKFEFNQKKAEILVIGAGAVGLITAIELAKQGKEVIVLEAGPKSPCAESQAFIEAASTSGKPMEGLHQGRFRALGGTTNFWGGQLVKFGRHIFDNREWVSDIEWPVSFDELDSYYNLAFTKLGMAEVLEDAAVWEKLKITPPKEYMDVDVHMTRWLPEPNFAKLFDTQIKELENLQVYINANVTSLISSDKGENITGVCFSDNKGESYKIEAENVLLANGTIEIVRLLNLHLSGGFKPLWANYKWLGVGFMDHLDCVAGSVIPNKKSNFSNIFDNAFISGLKYSPKLKLSETAQTSEKLLDISAHFIFKSSMSENLDNLKVFLKGVTRGKIDKDVSRNPFVLLKSLKYAIPMIWRYIRYNRMYNFADQGILLRLTSEQTPIISSKISLRGDKDKFGVPNVDVHWDYLNEDMKTIVNFAKRIKEYFKFHNLGEVKLDKRLEEMDYSFMTEIDDANHHMGGARMSLSEEDGVVDKNLRVHRTKNLYVVGAAVYPTTGFPNSTFTAIALGLRLADHLTGKSYDS